MMDIKTNGLQWQRGNIFDEIKSIRASNLIVIELKFVTLDKLRKAFIRVGNFPKPKPVGRPRLTQKQIEEIRIKHNQMVYEIKLQQEKELGILRLFY